MKWRRAVALTRDRIGPTGRNVKRRQKFADRLTYGLTGLYSDESGQTRPGGTHTTRGDMTATEKLEKITAALDAGSTVYLQTYTRTTKITAKNAAKFAAAGNPVVKVKGSSLYVIEGRRYVCADYCGIAIEGR